MKKFLFLISIIFIWYLWASPVTLAQALERARVEWGANSTQLKEISRILEEKQQHMPLTDDVVDEVIIATIFPEELPINQGGYKWFYVGDLISRLQNQHKKVIADSNHEWVFPHGLDLKHPLVHLVSFQQIYGTCGYHALANAHAIQKQVDEGIPAKNITFSETKRYAQQMFKNVLVAHHLADLEACSGAGDEEIGRILELADGKDVSVLSDVNGLGSPNVNYFVFAMPNIDAIKRRPVSTTYQTKAQKDAALALIDDQMQVIRRKHISKKQKDAELALLQTQRTAIVNEFTADEKQKFIDSLEKDFSENPLGQSREQFIQSLITNKATHFLILSPGHFTDLSVVQDGNDYRMFYLNSMNSADIGEYAKKFIKLIDELITEAQKRRGIHTGTSSSPSQEQHANELKRKQEQLARERAQAKTGIKKQCNQ